MKSLRIVFMGTPEFAVASLQALVEAGANVVGVVTMPDKPKGRHQDTLQPSPVKQYALGAGLPVLQPISLKSPEFLAELQALRPDLGVVVAFRMLPESVWSMPRLGTFNLHASLLPQYRGAAPINWAVINGDRQTGVTTFFLKHAIDTGNIIFQRTTPITDEDNAGTVHDRLMELGAALVVETVQAIANGTAPAQPQVETEPLRPAPKIFKETCRIDWNQEGRAVFNFIRGLAPYPAAWTTLIDGDKRTEIKIYKAHFEPISDVCTSEEAPMPTNLVASAPKPCICGKDTLTVPVVDGRILVDEIQIAGRRRMPIADFLRGIHNMESLFVE